MQDSLQHREDGLPVISQRQVIPRPNTSSLYSMGGLYLTKPCLIFSICAGLMNPSSPSKTFSYADMPPLMKQLSSNFQSPLQQHMSLGCMSPWRYFLRQRKFRAEQTEKMIFQISIWGMGWFLKASESRQSKGSYQMMTWLKLQQKMLVLFYYLVSLSTVQMQGNLNSDLYFIITSKDYSSYGLIFIFSFSLPRASIAACSYFPIEGPIINPTIILMIHSNIIMQLISSASQPDNLLASSARFTAISSRDTTSSFIFLRTKKDISESFMQSKRPSEPKTMKSASQVRWMCFIQGSDMTPYFLAALSPKALERASPGPQLFLPGAQILLGPEYLSLPISRGCMIPPHCQILNFQVRLSGLCRVQSQRVDIPWQRIAFESPTFIQQTLLSAMMTAKNVQPEKAISIPETSSSVSVFLSTFRMMCESNLCQLMVSCRNPRQRNRYYGLSLKQTMKSACRWRRVRRTLCRCCLKK